MESSYESLEIVRIASGLRLFDGDSYQRTYVPPQGAPLEPGLYIVHWPTHVAARRFDEHAVYRGPFADLEQARAALSMLRDRPRAQVGSASPGEPEAFGSDAAAATEAAPAVVPASRERELAPVIGVSVESRLDLESRIERSRREEHEFVAEWAMC